MASVATPYGFRTIQAMGGRPFSGGSVREFKMSANNAAGIFNGDLVELTNAGQPQRRATAPSANVMPASTGNATAGTVGIVGICVGARFVNAQGQFMNSHFAPANLITGGATDVWIRVMDDPYALFQIKGTAALGTFNAGTNGSGWPGAIGMNASITFVGSPSVATGNSNVALTVGADGVSLANTSSHPLRIIDIVRGTESDPYPEFIVKLNVGVHSYTNPLGLSV
jgi:hypothetical protein